MLIQAGPNWAAACPGASKAIDSTRYGIDGGALRIDECGKAGMSGLRPRGLSALRGVYLERCERPVLDEQGWSVSAGVTVDPSVDLEDTKQQPSAPATAHVTPIFMGLSGPSPWRRPV